MKNPTVYTNEGLPRFWWVNPWKHARNLHKAATALACLVAQQDDVLRSQRLAAKHKASRIAVLESQVREYRDARREGGTN